MSPKRTIQFTFCMYRESETLPSDSIVTVDAYDRSLDTYFAREGNYSRPIRHQDKERKDRFGDIDEKITREECTLDWSQSKVLLAIIYCLPIILSNKDYVREAS